MGRCRNVNINGRSGRGRRDDDDGDDEDDENIVFFCFERCRTLYISSSTYGSFLRWFLAFYFWGFHFDLYLLYILCLDMNLAFSFRLGLEGMRKLHFCSVL